MPIAYRRMARRKLSVAVVAVVLLAGPLLLPSVVRAQQPDTSQQKLPEIATQEFEIRGELQLSFPSLERQPLRGFASPPTIPSVPPEHTPFVESYKQDLEDLPESLPAPTTVTRSVAQTKAPQRGFIEAGGGRYASRFAAARYAVEFSPQQSLSVHADYDGTQGFSPYSGTASDLETPSDDVAGDVQFRSRHDGFSIQTRAFGSLTDYTLYGQPALTSVADTTAPTRTGTRLGIHGRLRTFGQIESRLGVGYASTGYTTDPASAASDDISEGRLTLDGRLEIPIGDLSSYVDASLARSSYSGDVSGSPSGFSVSGGAGAEIWSTDRLSVEAGVRVLSYSAPEDPGTTDDTESGTYVMPEARATYALTSSLTAFAENTPRLRQDGLYGLYRENPYANSRPSVRPTVFTTDANTGVRFSAGPVRVTTDAGLRYAPSYRFFSAPTTAQNLQVGYRSARILHGGAEVALQGIENVETSVSVSFRDGMLVGPDEPIPHFSPIVADAMFSVSFLNDKALLQTTGTVESARPAEVGTDREVDPYVSFDLEGSYQVTSLLDVLLKVQNLSPDAPTKWARYSRPPAAVQAGVRIDW